MGVAMLWLVFSRLEMFLAGLTNMDEFGGSGPHENF
jgi:hypothetical protein